MLLAVSARRKASFLAKGFGKREGILIPHRMGDDADRVVSFGQELGGVLHAVGFDVLLRRLANMLNEEAVQVSAIDVERIGDFAD